MDSRDSRHASDNGEFRGRGGPEEDSDGSDVDRRGRKRIKLVECDNGENLSSRGSPLEGEVDGAARRSPRTAPAVSMNLKVGHVFEGLEIQLPEAPDGTHWETGTCQGRYVLCHGDEVGMGRLPIAPLIS